MEKIKLTKKQLKRQLLESKGSSVVGHTIAYTNIEKASTDRMMAGAIVLQITELGGKKVISPITIGDGLSNETIDAIKKDIKRSHDLLTTWKI